MSTGTGPDTAVRRARVRAAVTVAARALPVHYPLETFIAVNPLAGFEDMDFESALHRAGELYGAPGTLSEQQFRRVHATGRITDADLDAVLRRRYPAMANTPKSLATLRADLHHSAPAPPPRRRALLRGEHLDPAVAAAVDAHTGQWCAAYLAAPGTPWAMPGWQEGFFPAWRALASRDRTLPRPIRSALAQLPERADDTVLQALDALAVPTTEHGSYLTAALTALPGWAAHVRWRSDHGPGGIDLVDYLAVRLSYEALLLTQVNGAKPPPGLSSPGAGHTVSDQQQAGSLSEAGHDDELTSVPGAHALVPAAERTTVWLEAYEEHYRSTLLAHLDRVGVDAARSDAARSDPAEPGGTGQVSTDRPAAQVVCCIDVRSEGLRRHLEGRGAYETLGFAGFFAVAIRFTDLARGGADALCPVLIDPSSDVTERPTPGADALAARRLAGLQAGAGATEAFHAAKEALLSPFALAEASGWIAGPVAVARTLLPRWAGSVRSRLRAAVAPPAPTELDISYTDDERALFAEVALTTMGLTDGFARLVVLCAHGSTSENNPYQASLDCGACGGQPGGPNARTATAILNSAAVREHLRSRGIDIPADTWFVAAEHDTTTDRVAVLDAHLVPADHHTDLAALRADLDAAGAALAAERARTLPGAPTGARGGHVGGRSTDWAQVYPEWGLAGNAAFVVGPRTMTAGLDLGRRVFLHSYDARVDPDGAALETILTAPMVVAQWISCQYYFSTVAPQVFGAGTKTIHNVIGGVGVIAGHDGDLQLGLPWQSVAHGDRLVHEPMRLLTVVQAPFSVVAAVIARNPVLGRLFHHGWVALAVREDPGAPWQRYTRDGFAPWAGPTSTSTSTSTTDTPTNTDEETPCPATS